MSEEPKDDEVEVPSEAPDSPEDAELSEDAIASILGESSSEDPRDPEEVTADQVDALKEMMGEVSEAVETSDETPSEEPESSENVDPDDIASILEQATEDSQESESSDKAPEAEASAEPSAENTEETASPEDATADQIDALAGLMGNFDSGKSEDSDTEPSEDTEAPSAEPEEATADQVDELASMMGGFGASKSEEPKEEEASSEEPVSDTVDPDDIASILAAESPEVEETPEPEVEAPKIDPENIAKDEGILTPDILEKLILTMPSKEGEESAQEAVAPEPTGPKMSSEEVDKILGSEEIKETADEEEISADELARMLEAEEAKKEEEGAAPEEAVPEEVANIVTAEDDLEEEELAEPEESAEPEKAPETTEEPEPEEKPKAGKFKISIPFPSSARKVLMPLGFAASVAVAGLLSSLIVIKFAAPKSPGGTHGLDAIPVIGAKETIPASVLQPLIDKALEPYHDLFEIHQGWIHAVAHSGVDASAVVPLTAVTKEPLFEIVDATVLTNRLVLTPERFDSLRKELLDKGSEVGPPRPPAPSDAYTRERFKAGFSTRAVLNFYGTRDGDDWKFSEPQWQVSDQSGELPRGFISDFLGKSIPINDPRVNTWIDRYNQAAVALINAAQAKSELANLSDLQKRIDARLSLFEPFEILSGRMYTPENLDRGINFNTIITDVYEDGFFEGYFEMREAGRDPKRFSGRVSLNTDPSGELVQTANIRTFRESGFESGTENAPRIFIRGNQDSISLRAEPGFLSGRLDDMYITLTQP